MENHHLQEGISSGQESTHHSLKELLALLLPVVDTQLQLELGKQGLNLLLLEVHDGLEDLEDGIQDELVESTLKLLALIGTVLGPLLGGGVEVVVALL